MGDTRVYLQEGFERLLTVSGLILGSSLCYDEA